MRHAARPNPELRSHTVVGLPEDMAIKLREVSPENAPQTSPSCPGQAPEHAGLYRAAVPRNPSDDYKCGPTTPTLRSHTWACRRHGQLREVSPENAPQTSPACPGQAPEHAGLYRAAVPRNPRTTTNVARLPLHERGSLKMRSFLFCLVAVAFILQLLYKVVQPAPSCTRQRQRLHLSTFPSTPHRKAWGSSIADKEDKRESVSQSSKPP